jgi:hypothetical protein
MMTPNDWLRAITTVVMPMLVGAVLTFMAVLIIE